MRHARRALNDHLIPDRQWIASITFHDGRRMTATIYGRNCSEAEQRYCLEHPNVRSVVVRQECSIR